MTLLKWFFLPLFFLSTYASAQSVSMITMHWPPFYGNEELDENGFITAITRAAFEASGYQTDLTISSWTDSMEQVKNGNKDLLVGAYYSEERAQDYYYSLPMFKVQTGLIKKKNLPLDLYTSYDMLNDYNLGKLDGGIIGESFDHYDFQNMKYYKEVLPALKALNSGEIDLYADALAVVRHFAPQAGLEASELVLVQPPIAENDLYLIISKVIPNALDIRDAFNAGLVQIQANGTYEKILKKFNQL